MDEFMNWVYEMYSDGAWLPMYEMDHPSKWHDAQIVPPKSYPALGGLTEPSKWDAVAST